MRGGITRHQEAKYQYRSVAVARSIFCGYGPILGVSVPDDLLELKNVAIHASIVFDVSVASGNRKLHWIGGRYTLNPYPDQTASSEQAAMIHILQSADANRRVDVTIDISHLIPELTIDTNPTFDQPSFEVSMVTDPTGANSVTGVLEIWKVDLIYTTKGIQ